MPGYDGTGPDGKGPGTGLMRGYCALSVAEFLASRSELGVAASESGEIFLDTARTGGVQCRSGREDLPNRPPQQDPQDSGPAPQEKHAT